MSSFVSCLVTSLTNIACVCSILSKNFHIIRPTSLFNTPGPLICQAKLSLSTVSTPHNHMQKCPILCRRLKLQLKNPTEACAQLKPRKL